MTYEDLLGEARRSVDAALERLGLPRGGYAVEPASRPGFGDASCNAAFVLARESRTAPRELASRIAAECARAGMPPLIARVEAHASGHVNFFADAAPMARSVIAAALGGSLGRPDVGAGEHVTIEHTSVNPNKALHVGHVRNVVLGDSLARVLEWTGHSVRVLNYVDDSGLQVANLIMGFTDLGFARDPPEGVKFDAYCGDTVYVRAMERIDADPALQARAAQILSRIERGDSEEGRMARELTRAVLDAQLETCWRLGASYDCINYESHIVHSGMWAQIFEQLRERRLVRLEGAGKNAGCWVVPAGEGEDDKVLVRSGGTATYMAKDIPYAAWKLGAVEDPFTYSDYPRAQPGARALAQTAVDGSGARRKARAGRVITVIDSRQSRLQRIIASLLRLFFGARAGSYVHLAYESVTLSASTAAELGIRTERGVQMSGRRGVYVSADGLLDMLHRRARSTAEARNADLAESELDSIAEDIAVGAVRYEMIRQDTDKVIAFDLARSLSLEGDTAARIQYSHARAERVLERAGGLGGAEPDYGALGTEHDAALVRAVGSFGLAVRDAAANLSPRAVARYSHSLTEAFNAFYAHVRILGAADPRESAPRVELVRAFKLTQERALALLGIRAPGRM